MELRSSTRRQDRCEWEAPTVEEISVSAEVTAYVGTRDFDGE